jgi:translation initiation factor 2B subunit (eIF-2B alpha/beta/delta family)
MRRKLIAGNWKMYKTVSEAVTLVEDIKKGAAGAPSDILVSPPYTSLVAAVAAAKGSPVAVAAQNMHFEKEGAFTGEVSAAMRRPTRASRRRRRSRSTTAFSRSPAWARRSPSARRVARWRSWGGRWTQS